MAHSDKEWENEPDHLIFTHRDHKCEIIRDPDLKHLKGYVYIPIADPHHDAPLTPKMVSYLIDYPVDQGFDYTHFEAYFNIDVHGGLTFGRVIETMDQTIYIKVGFDCSHYRDLMPGLEVTIRKNRRETGILTRPAALRELVEFSTSIYRNVDFVKKELMGIVDTLLEGGDRHDET